MSDSQKEIIFGRNPVKEALRIKKVKSIYLLNGFHDQEVLSLIKSNNVNVKFVSNKELDKMADGGTHQGIVAEIKGYEYYSFEDVISITKKKEKQIILILDGINDPHNFGAILRNADIFDVGGVIISKHNQVGLNATVAKTSAGAINFVPVAMVNNLNQAIDKLKADGFWIVSSDGMATINYLDLDYDFPVALVIGSEGYGISKLVLKNSDYVVKINMYGKVNSLNASVASGILLAKIKG